MGGQMLRFTRGLCLLVYCWSAVVECYSLGRQDSSSDSLWSSGVRNYVNSLEPNIGPLVMYKSGGLEGLDQAHPGHGIEEVFFTPEDVTRSQVKQYLFAMNPMKRGAQSILYQRSGWPQVVSRSMGFPYDIFGSIDF